MIKSIAIGIIVALVLFLVIKNFKKIKLFSGYILRFLIYNIGIRNILRILLRVLLRK